MHTERQERPGCLARCILGDEGCKSCPLTLPESALPAPLRTCARAKHAHRRGCRNSWWPRISRAPRASPPALGIQLSVQTTLRVQQSALAAIQLPPKFWGGNVHTLLSGVRVPARCRLLLRNDPLASWAGGEARGAREIRDHHELRHPRL